MPAVWAYYYEAMVSLLRWSPKLVRNFANSVFASVAFNFGPVTVCKIHTDDANLSWGWCAITALGRFDFHCGGHLVLWDLGLIIPFPPGATILLPSALLAHSNTLIQPGETRYSITQYSASGLFRWVENGMMSDKDCVRGASKREKAVFHAGRKSRWSNAMKMWPVA